MSTPKNPKFDPDTVLSRVVNIATLFATNWGFVASVAVAVVTTSINSLFDIASASRVQVGVGVFLACLWAYIGISILHRMRVGIKVIPLVDYSHAIIVEEVAMRPVMHEGRPHLFIQTRIRNVCNSAITVMVKDYRVVIGGRTLPESDGPTFPLPRVGARTIDSGFFDMTVLEGASVGSLVMVLEYGPIGSSPVRRFTGRGKLRVSHSPAPSIHIETNVEEDVAI